MKIYSRKRELCSRVIPFQLTDVIVRSPTITLENYTALWCLIPKTGKRCVLRTTTPRMSYSRKRHNLIGTTRFRARYVCIKNVHNLNGVEESFVGGEICFAPCCVRQRHCVRPTDSSTNPRRPRGIERQNIISVFLLILHFFSIDNLRL